MGAKFSRLCLCGQNSQSVVSQVDSSVEIPKGSTQRGSDAVSTTYFSVQITGTQAGAIPSSLSENCYFGADRESSNLSKASQSPSKRSREERQLSRKSIKFQVELKEKSGEQFWNDNQQSISRRSGPVVVSNSADEEEDSQQEIGFVNQYVFVKNIGEGASGVVKLAVNEDDDCFYAIKILSRSSEFRRVSISKRGNKRLSIIGGTLREVAMLKKLSHPNMINLLEVIDDPMIDRLYLVFEYVPGGSVFDSSTEMEPMAEGRARKYIRDIVLGLEYVHGQGVIHGDL